MVKSEEWSAESVEARRIQARKTDVLSQTPDVDAIGLPGFVGLHFKHMRRQ